MQDILLFTTVLLCLSTDLAKRKIYNIVLLPALLLAICINLFQHGLSGINGSILGLILGMSILIIPFIMGGIGAGDVKLLSVIGAIKGPEFVIYTFVYMGIAGGIIAAFILYSRGKLLETLKEITKVIYLLLCSQFKLLCIKTDKEIILFPYGIAIAIGTIIAFYSLEVMR